MDAYTLHDCAPAASEGVPAQRHSPQKLAGATKCWCPLRCGGSVASLVIDLQGVVTEPCPAGKASFELLDESDNRCFKPQGAQFKLLVALTEVCANAICGDK